MTEEDATAQEAADPEAAEASAVDDEGAEAEAEDAEAEEEREATDEEQAAFGQAEAHDHPELAADVAALDEELATEVSELARREAELADEVEELTERLQRTQADFQNYKKRAKKRQDQLEERATRDLVERLLDVRDDLGRALADESGDVEALRDGVELTVEEFDRVLDDEGVSEIEPAPGDEVDPSRHEVMLTVDSTEPKGAVAEVYRPGYEMAGTVLRAAQVTVSDGGGEGGRGGDVGEGGDDDPS